jgi:hypothetical protein
LVLDRAGLDFAGYQDIDKNIIIRDGISVRRIIIEVGDEDLLAVFVEGIVATALICAGKLA